MRVCRDFSMYKFAYGFLMDFGSWSYRCVLLKVGMYGRNVVSCMLHLARRKRTWLIDYAKIRSARSIAKLGH